MVVAGLLTAALLSAPFVASAFLSTAPTGLKTWYWQNPVPQGNDLFDVTTIGSSDVWAVGAVGTLLHSGDGGVTWDTGDPNTQLELRGIDFAGSSAGWVVGATGTIRATVDGGSTWTMQTSGTAANLRSVAFADAQTGWVVGATGTIRATVDGGSTWAGQNSATTQQLNGVDAASTTRAWVVGNAATLKATTDGGSTWTSQTVPPGVTVNLNGVDFVDAQTGYVVGNAGVILKTVDGGSTWTTQTSGTASNLLAVAFADGDTGWAVGAGGTIIRTTDGGATWTPGQYGANITLNSVAMFGSGGGQVVGNTGAMLRTTDSGASWLNQSPGTTVQLNDVFFLDSSTGWAAGASGMIAKTTDGGGTWIYRSAGGATAWQGIHFADAQHGWVVGTLGRIRRTTDGGATWTEQPSGVAVTLNSVSAVSSQTAFAVGNTGTMLKTVDGGSTWTTLPVGVSTNLMDVFFLDETTGWVCGQTNVIRKTIDGGATWVAQPLGATSYLRDIHFADANNGVVVGSTNNVIRYTTNGGATWNAATNPAGAYYGVVMGDASNGWAVGTNGRVARTTNGGLTWVAQDAKTSPTTALYGVSAVGPDRGWLVGAGGTIRRTIDGGANWTSVSYGTLQQLNAISIHDPLTGWVVGNAGTILCTTDGLSWVAQASGTTSHLLGVDFVSATHGWAVGAAGAVRATSDGGSTWAGQSSGTTVTINAVDFVDVDTGWYAANSATIGRTADGGSTWATQTAPSIATSVALYGVSFADADTGWVVGGVAGQPAAVLKTTDGGSTWTTQTTSLPVGRILYAVSAIDTQTVWAVGSTGSVIRTTDGGTTWATVPSGTTATLYAVRFEGADRGYYVGALSGTVSVIRRTNDGGATWVSQNPGTTRALRGVDFAGVDDGVIVGAGGTILRTTDASPPETEIAFDPADPDGWDGWYVTPPELSFSTTEPAVTYCSIDATTGPWAMYSSPFAMTREGTVTIAYYSVDAGGNRETTKTVTVKHDRGAPTTPTLLAASVTSTTATLTWAPSYDTTSGLAYYEVLQDGSVVGTSAVPAITLTGLTPEVETTFTVRAYDVAGNVSGESDPAEVFTLGELPRPPAIVFARAAYRNAVQVNWGETTGTVGPVSYLIYRALDGGPYSFVATVPVSYPGSWVDTSLVAPVVASYRVAVADARGEGIASAEATSAVATLTALPAPPGLRALATTAGVETSWTAVPGATGYLVYRSTTSTGAPSLITSPAVVTTSHIDTSTAIDTGYWYRVAAVDASGVAGATGLGVYVHTLSDATTDSPHGEYDPFTDDCALCHRSHTSSNSLALLVAPGDNEIALCLSCHDGTSAPDVFDDFSDTEMVSRHPVSVEDTVTVLRCGQCHTPHNDNGGPELGKLLYAPGGVRSGDAICYACHGADTTLPRGDLTVFESSGHRASVPAPADAVEVVCLACHEGHSTRESALVPYSADQRCVWCHSAAYSLLGAADIAATLAGEDSTTRHDLLEADQSANGSMIACANCHEPHVSAPDTPTVDPDDPSTSGGWTGTLVGLCLRCHDTELPTSAETSGWAPVPLGPAGAVSVSDIESSWAGDVHGEAVSSPSHLRPDMGWAPGDPLSCETCHDPHGSLNRWGLAESVAASGTPIVVEGLAVVPVGSGADVRFFCGSCHIVGPSTHPGVMEGGADLTVWPIDCTAGGCHAHAGTGL